MTPAEIRFELDKRNITQASIAIKERVQPISVSRVIDKFIISDKLMRAVSEAIEEDHRLVFPEYYLRPAKRSTSKVEPDN